MFGLALGDRCALRFDPSAHPTSSTTRFRTLDALLTSLVGETAAEMVDRLVVGADTAGALVVAALIVVLSLTHVINVAGNDNIGPAKENHRIAIRVRGRLVEDFNALAVKVHVLPGLIERFGGPRGDRKR